MSILDDFADIRRILKVLSASPVYYPWAVIPPDGESFDFVNTITLPASGGGAGFSPGVETLVTQLSSGPLTVPGKCPLGYDGLVLRLSNNYLGPGFNPGLPSLTWRIRVGSSINPAQNRFVKNYNNITVEYGTTNQPRTISGVFVSSGQNLLYTVTNNDAGLPVGNSQVTCCFSGLFWPQQREKQGEA